ncbi:MAG: heme peroxidase family protein [Chloroflexota bacterium]|nr:heme peroxidase family protein [Chloroflexota bacterium]
MSTEHRHARKSWHHHRFSRRKFLGGMAALSVGAVIGGRLPTAARAADAGDGLHGVELRGMYLTSKDRLAEGRFGAMFKRLPAFAPRDDLLTSLAKTMVEDQTRPDDEHLNTSPRLFAGFTFIGQFIDHDITFDNTPLDLQLADPDARVNFRTPRYDLDSVYGRGPVYEPALYDPADRDKLLVTPNVNAVYDVPRDADGHALIPERRNDENLIIVQLHKAVAQFHNRLVDYARSQGIRSEWVFEAARRLTRWHYQWAVIHDFLPRFVGDELVGPTGTVYRDVTGQAPVINLNYYRPTNKDGRPFMPVEFAVAAYRFGHSIIRPFYVINQTTLDAGGVPIFGATPGFNLNGGRPVPADLVVEWKNILPVDPNFPARKPRKIDTKLSLPLTSLPGSVVPPPDPTVHLAVRNTLRGKRVGLPSGQQVAKAMRFTALSNAKLGVSSDPGWGGEAPLWFYILRESELAPYNTERLGAVGGRIVAEVLVGLLQRDPNSYLYLDPAWRPAPPIAPTAGQFGFVDLLRYAGAA